MEDDKIKDLFQTFRPDLSSDRLFMAKLEQNLHAVEIVKQHNAAVLRRNRRAVVVAALMGMVTGVILTSLYPTICLWVSSITFSLPSIGFSEISLDGQIASWMIITALCATVALNAYELTLSRLSLLRSDE